MLSDADLISLAGQRMICRYSDGQPIRDRESGQDITEQVERLAEEGRLVVEERTGPATFYVPKS